MKIIQKISRQKRIRAKIKGTAVKPRLSVFRSNKYIYAQVIDDVKAHTIVGASESEITAKDTNKTNKAKELGKIIAKKAIAKKVSEVIFDRGSYRYHGRVKAVAEGAREGGLKF
jgi:large subunit ribosomal protein L18